MDKKLDKKALAAAVGTAFAASLVSAPIASADSNPFGINELSGGYMQVAAENQSAGTKPMEGNCGGKKMEGICGADANKDGKITKAEYLASKEARFKKADSNADGVLDAKEVAAMKAAKAAPKEGNCGGKPMPKGKEGQCGEGKCAGTKK